MRSRGARRGVPIALLALLAGLALSGCTGSDEAAGAGTELSFFIFNEPSGAYQEAAAKCSEESNGQYTISFEFLPAQADAQREQLVRRLGAEDDSIDIIGHGRDLDGRVRERRLDPAVGGELAEQVTDGVFDSVVESASFEGQLYAAPFTSNTQLLWYRKDRVHEPPTTWQEMLDQALEIGPAEGQIQVQANRYEGFTVWINSMIGSAGGEILSGPTEVALEQGPTEEAIAAMAEFASSPVAPPEHRHLDRGHGPAGLRGRRLELHDQLSLRIPERERERAGRLQADGRGEVPGDHRGHAIRVRRSGGSTSGYRRTRTTPT